MNRRDINTTPNFFIAIKISDKEIISNMEKLQKSLQLNLNPWVMKRAMTPLNRLHFTLLVLKLDTPEDVDEARKAFQQCCYEIEKEFSKEPLKLTVGGVGKFGAPVLYAKLSHERHISQMEKIYNLFQQKFEEIGFPSLLRPNLSYSPHMTIFNFCWLKGNDMQKYNAFPLEEWCQREGREFGTERVGGIQLLRMKDIDPETDYYRCFAEHKFSNGP